MADENEDMKAKPLGTEDNGNAGGGGGTSGGKKTGRKNYIICIGIGEYENPKLSLGTCCVNDCKDLMKLLKEDYSFETVRGSYDKNANKINDDELVLLNEEATLDNIEDLFKKLAYHPDFKRPRSGEDLPAHNLIIYYSGHGTTLKNDDGKEFFYWVPYDYTEDIQQPDPYGLYSVFFNLIQSLNNIRYHSLIIISDACHSAATFELTSWFTAPGNVKPGSDPENERSLWAICSSAANQLSYVDDNHSFFTKRFLYELESNQEERIDIERLGLNLKELLIKSEQRVFPGRLNLIQNNTGSFYFICNENKRKKQEVFERRQRLKDDVYKLNFKKHREEVEDWRRRLDEENRIGAMRYFVCISAGPDYALKMAHYHIARSAFFPVSYPSTQRKPCLLNMQENLSPSEEFVMGLLCKELQLPLTFDKAEFNKSIGEKLKTASVILEILIDPESITPGDKDKYVKKFYEVLSGISLSQDVLHPFCILFIDSDGTDYSSIAGSFPGGEVVKFISPTVTDVDAYDLTRWTNDVRGSSEEQRLKYDKLFKEVIECVKSQCFPSKQSKYPPGKFIQALCEKSGCPDLVLNILNF